MGRPTSSINGGLQPDIGKMQFRLSVVFEIKFIQDHTHIFRKTNLKFKTDWTKSEEVIYHHRLLFWCLICQVIFSQFQFISTITTNSQFSVQTKDLISVFNISTQVYFFSSFRFRFCFLSEFLALSKQLLVLIDSKVAASVFVNFCCAYQRTAYDTKTQVPAVLNHTFLIKINLQRNWQF